MLVFKEGWNKEEWKKFKEGRIRIVGEG